MLHGVLLIALFACAAFYIGGMDCVKALSFSPMVVGIIIGMLYANSLRNNLPDTWVPGIKFCSKRILRTGIILYGFKLTFQDVMAVGFSAIVMDAIIVCGTMWWHWQRTRKPLVAISVSLKKRAPAMPLRISPAP